ncbi:hypothetical protein PLCT2_02499 [Planctomycetaceae bacterium]|nr:hypothetical protein PLCT2_02499 [Planctomycetaceae bacterium]
MARSRRKQRILIKLRKMSRKRRKEHLEFLAWTNRALRTAAQLLSQPQTAVRRIQQRSIVESFGPLMQISTVNGELNGEW